MTKPEKELARRYELYLHGEGVCPARRGSMPKARYLEVLDEVNARLGRPTLRGRLPGRDPEAVNVGAYPTNEEGAFELPADLDIEGADLRGPGDRAVWSVGQDAEGRRFAALNDSYYQRQGYTCVWLR